MDRIREGRSRQTQSYVHCSLWYSGPHALSHPHPPYTHAQTPPQHMHVLCVAKARHACHTIMLILSHSLGCYSIHRWPVSTMCGRYHGGSGSGYGSGSGSGYGHSHSNNSSPVNNRKAKAASPVRQPKQFLSPPSTFSSPGSVEGDDDLEDLDPAAQEAANWTNGQIKKLIEMIQHYGERDASTGVHNITFGHLFEETANVFDALSGICKTARKYVNP